VSLESRFYSISEINIRSRRIDIYDELNKVIKKLSKSKDQLKRHSITSFETIDSFNLIEKGEILSEDIITSRDGYIFDKRLYTNYQFDTSSIFIHADIDKLIRQINLTSRKGIRHLLNRRKIRKAAFNKMAY